MKTITYNLANGGKMTVEYDEMSPCIFCAEPVGEASMGGVDICPSCDCGKCRFCGVDLPYGVTREESIEKIREHIAWHKAHPVIH